jgi:hypothetical protein
MFEMKQVEEKAPVEETRRGLSRIRKLGNPATTTQYHLSVVPGPLESGDGSLSR